MYFGLLIEAPIRTQARLILLKHMHTSTPGQTSRNQATMERFAIDLGNSRAESYITHTLLSVGSRRMGSCMRGEPWCDEMTGSKLVKAQWATYREKE